MDEVQAKRETVFVSKHGKAVANLPATYPNDPADHIIGATLLVEGLPLVTADREIRRSKAFQTIW
jgi:PIN domain nuclease of toxin-antitoxin system